MLAAAISCFASALDGLTRHSSSSSITVISRVAAPAAPRAFSSTSTPYPKTFLSRIEGDQQPAPVPCFGSALPG